MRPFPETQKIIDECIVAPLARKCLEIIMEHADLHNGEWVEMGLSYAMIKRCEQLGLSLSDPVTELPKPVLRYVLPKYPEINISEK